MGARVINVESLEQARERLSLGMKRARNGVEERVLVYQYSDRNKQAITLNLMTATGVELFKELARHVDGVVETPHECGWKSAYGKVSSYSAAFVDSTIATYGQT